VLTWVKPYWLLAIPTVITLVVDAVLSVSPVALIGIFVGGVLKGGMDYGKLQFLVDYFPFLSGEATHGLGAVFFVSISAVILGVVFAIVGFCAQWLQKYVMNHVTVDMRCSVCQHLLSLPMSFHHEERRGELYARLTSDLAVSRQAVDLLLSDMITQPFTLLVGAGCAFFFSWQMAAVVFVAIPLPLWALAKLGGKIKKSGLGRQVKMGELTHLMVQFLSGIRIVKAFSMEEEEMRRFRQANEHFVRRAMRVVLHKATSNALFRFVSYAGLAMVLLAGGFLLVHNWFGMNAANFASFLTALAMMYSPSRALVKAFNRLQESLAGTERVLQLLETEPNITDAPNAIELRRIQREIRFRDVSFSYDTQPVLKNISFVVPVGQTVAIVGRSGAGKSTLVDLIPRFYDPVEGSVEIDGIDLRRVTRQSLLNQIAIVSQDPFLFDTAILDNIRYGRRNTTDDEVVEAARAANIHDVIQELPEQYLTVVGERGAKLSGGERQRITIARAIIKDAPILILDEATSSLDMESEALIQEALERLMVGRTTFVIAHRLSTVEHADKIIVLKDGEIIESGTHDSLLQHQGEYWRLYKMDFRSANGSRNANGDADRTGR